MAREWPYGLLIALGSLLLFVVHPSSVIVANRLIEDVSGFFPNIFPNSQLFFQLAFCLFLLVLAYTIASGLLAAATGFCDDQSRRVFPIAFAFAFPCLMLPTFGLSTIERVIQILDFSENGKFQIGLYLGNDHRMHSYGTLTCAGASLPAGARLAPHPDGGYVLAVPKEMPKLHNDLLLGLPVQTTAYLSSRLPADKCPIANQFIDKPEPDSR